MLTVLASLEPTLNVIKTVLGIGGLIFVHELGHFLVGRLCGVRAEIFSIGFGPAIWKWQPGETEYRLAPIPLGGYVKFLGESPDEGVTAPDSFLAATYPRKAAIMLAGVTMNVLTAFALFVWTFSIGVELPAPVVGTVSPGSPAWVHGIQPGDEVVSIDGSAIIDFSDIVQDVVLAEAVDIEIRRDGKLLPAMHIRTTDDGSGIHKLGFGPASLGTAEVRVVPDSPAAQAGLRDGDRVIALDGEPVATTEDVIAAVLAAPGAATRSTAGHTLTIERDGQRIELTLAPATETVRRIGVAQDALVIGAVRIGGPAAAADVREGDRPVAVDGEPVATVRQMAQRLVGAAEPGAVVTFLRGGARMEVAVGDDPVAFAMSLTGGGDDLVVSPAFPGESVGPAARAGLMPGATILAADGMTVRSMDDLRTATKRSAESGDALTLRWRDLGGEEHTAQITPEAIEVPADLGIAAGVLTHVVHETDVVAAVALGMQRTHRWVSRILGTLGSLLTGKVSATNLSGPVAIAQHTYKQAETGLGQFLLFLGFISMNLAVLNLLPIPMLDGGQLAMITAEKIRWRPLPETVQAGLQWAGLILLLGLMVFVVANDIRKL